MPRGVQITLKVKGASLVEKALERLRILVPQIATSRLLDAANDIIARMRRYPPEREGQTYVRTYRLRDLWRVAPANAPPGYTISNATPYTKWVVGDAGGGSQAWMHVDRWQLFRDVTDWVVARLPKTVASHIFQKAKSLIDEAKYTGYK